MSAIVVKTAVGGPSEAGSDASPEVAMSPVSCCRCRHIRCRYGHNISRSGGVAGVGLQVGRHHSLGGGSAGG